MNKLQQIDAVILDGQIGVQAIVNVVEWTTGFKYYTVARFVLVVTVAWAVLVDSVDYQLLLSVAHPDAWRPGVALGCALLVLCLLFGMITMVQQTAKRGLSNSLREQPAALFFRMAFLVLVFYVLVRSYWDPAVYLPRLPFQLGLTLTLYIISCNEAPPRQRPASVSV